MKKQIVGENIIFSQIFVIIINIISLIFLLYNTTVIIALLGNCVFVIFLYYYLRLYSLSIEGDYFIVENLFCKKKIKKGLCRGIRKISNIPFIVGIEFQDFKEFRFQLGSNASFKSMFSFGNKSPEDDLFNEIQAFIDSSIKPEDKSEPDSSNSLIH
jgi:hypothetical protein